MTEKVVVISELEMQLTRLSKEALLEARGIDTTLPFTEESLVNFDAYVYRQWLEETDGQEKVPHEPFDTTDGVPRR